ncbi:MAG TPA: ribosomal biogenesis protein [Methanobacterium sp.]|nr:ribosomal biogenesis protein [Methanobacterium sp.]
MERVFDSTYVNRGKMSRRDVLIKSRASGYDKTAIISEIKGNPSRIELFDPEGYSLLVLDVTVTNPAGSGRISKKDLHLRWELDDSEFKEKITSQLDVPEESGITSNITNEEIKHHKDSNLIHVRKGKDKKAVVEFHDRNGQITGPRLYIRKCRAGV